MIDSTKPIDDATSLDDISGCYCFEKSLWENYFFKLLELHKVLREERE